MDLFGNDNEVIRTIGLYQPYASLMLHGKIETRWVMKGKKPPFPFGQYLIYSTKKPATETQQIEWSGQGELQEWLCDRIASEITVNMNGYAIAIGRLVRMDLMAREQEYNCFVKYVGQKNKQLIKYSQWCLYFTDVKRIIPFEFKHGKQGVGIYPQSEKYLIKVIN
jgi:hypothetical protein